MFSERVGNSGLPVRRDLASGQRFSSNARHSDVAVATTGSANHLLTVFELPRVAVSPHHPHIVQCSD